MVAESVAWCCCQARRAGLNINSIPYRALWAESASLEVLEQTATLTDRLAERIEAALLPDAPCP